MEKYRRVMLKLSGEALAGQNGRGYEEAVVKKIAEQVRTSILAGVEIGIVTGGGNYWRGRTSEAISRPKADQIGMLATVMNCIYVSEIFRTEGMKTAVLSPFQCGGMTELFSVDRADQYLKSGTVVFFAGGTGHPFFSTDTGTALMAAEIGADVILLAKSIDGVYTADPKLDPGARRYDRISMQEMVEKKLGVIDLTASVLCMENRIPLAVFDLNQENSIADAMQGKINGTVVTVD